MANKSEKAQIDLIINGATANRSIRDLEAAARSLKSTMRGMTDSKELEASKAKLEKIKTALQELNEKGGLVKNTWDKMKDGFKNTFTGMLGANLVTNAIQKVTSTLVDSFNAAVKLSDQMADVRKTTGMTAVEVKNLRTELSLIDTRTSMSDLMEIAKVGGQFGVANDQILGFVKAVDMTTVALGDEFTGGAEQVATEMAKLRNIFKDIQSDDIGTDVNYIANSINILASSGVATGPVISDLANRIGGYGIQVGLTSGQVLGLSATLQELGVSSERGGTAVVKILQKMLTNSSEFAKIAKMEIGQFKDLLNKDLYGAFVKVMQGSKELGPNAGLLADIIKDLEVQGAGASEVFAKLGGNIGMLKEKTALANEGLTNTKSIMGEFELKSNNLAGNVEKLSKEWNKLSTNPAMVSFFNVIVESGRGMVLFLKDTAELLKYSYDIITKGQKEADRVYHKALHQEQFKEEFEQRRQFYNDKVASYKQHLMTLNAEQLIAKKISQKIKVDAGLQELDTLKKNGADELFWAKYQQVKMYQQEYGSIDRVIKMRIDSNKKGEEELSKEEKSAAKKKAQEAQTELDRVYKLQMNHYDDLIKAAEKSGDEELKALVKTNQEKFKEISDYSRKEIDAALQLMQIKAKTQDEEKLAIEQMYLDKMAGLDINSNQYKLLYEQKKKELADVDKKYADESIKTEEDLAAKKVAAIQQYGNAAMTILGSLKSIEQAAMASEMSKFTSAQNQKKARIKKDYENHLITREQYEQQMAGLDAESEQKEREMRKRQAESEKSYAVFESSLKAALAWVEAIINPTKIPQAIAATVQAGVVAATPIPEFYKGGWMPNSSNDKQAFPIIAHANEYMVDAKSTKDPYVMNTIGLIEQAKQRGMSPSQLAAQSTSTIEKHTTTTINQTDDEMKELMRGIKKLLEQPVQAEMVFDDEKSSKLRKRLDKDTKRDDILKY